MRIQTIEITNYKAFLGTYKIRVGGKNLFIYGENGSGKSSLYYALKDFFQLFDLLVKGVLKHFKYSLTGGRELGELWQDVEQSIARTTGREYPINKKKTDVNSAIKIL